MHAAPEKLSQSGFWGQRTGWTIFKQVMLLEPLPGGSRWAAAFGSLLLLAFVLQVVTGTLLAMNYAPSIDSAWPSVKFIQEEVPLGSFVRGLHHWGSSAMVILLLVHLVQVFVWGAYKKPREFTWMVGVVLLALTLGLAFTGYLLPWDQKAYWATKVGLGIASTTPGIGDGLRTLLQGGPQMGNLTLTRFFALHALVLPGLLIFFVVIHLYLFRLHGVTPPWWVSAEKLRAKQEPFWPMQLLKDGTVWLVFLVALGLWAYNQPAPLEAQADPAQPYEARPEWYFMFLFQLLRYFEGPYEVVGTFVLPTLFFFILLLWPFLDRNPQRDPRRRPVAISLLGFATAGLIGMTVFAMATDVRMTEPSQTLAAAPIAATPAGPIQRADVARVYNDQCAACHGVDGSGKLVRAGMPTIPDLTSLAWQMSQTDLEITDRINSGNEPLMPSFRDKLSQRQILALAVYVRAFAVTPHDGRAPKPAGSAPAVAAQMSPVLVYRAYCMACHDANGSGEVARKSLPDLPNFGDAKWQASRLDAELKKSILDGKGKFMLPMSDKLSPRDADQMVAYVRGFKDGKQSIAVGPQPLVPASPTEPRIVTSPNAASDAQPAQAAPSQETAARMREATVLYRQLCLVCHGTDGRGSAMRASMPAIPDFTSPGWQAGLSSAQRAASILDGKSSLMPAFRGRISEDQAHDLAAYVRAFGPPPATAPPAADFERRFQELQDQWSELQKQLQDLSNKRR